MSEPLILLLPLLVLAAVLLFSFAGCNTIAGLDKDFVVAPPPAPPPGARKYEEEVPKTPGFAAYWRLGDANPPDAVDEGPNKLKGTYHGGVTLRTDVGALEKPDPADRAPHFNGQDGYVEVPADARLNTPSFSVEAWIRPSALAAGPQAVQHVVASHDVVNSLDLGYELTVIRQPDPKPRIQGRVCTGVATPDQAVEVVFELPDAQIGGPGNDWKHVVLTYDGVSRTATLYVDAVVRQSKANVGYTPNSGQPFRIGAGRTQQQPAPAQFFAGAIDEVAIYNSALNPGEVQDHFQLAGR
jgi:predicted small secreted protein